MLHVSSILVATSREMFFEGYVSHLRQECHNSKFCIFLVIGIERNVSRCTFNRYSVITQFAKLAAGEQLCSRCTHRKLQHFKTFKSLS